MSNHFHFQRETIWPRQRWAWRRQAQLSQVFGFLALETTSLSLILGTLWREFELCIYILGLKFSAGSRGYNHQGLVLSAFPLFVSMAWDSRAYFILIIGPPDYLPCLLILIIWQTALVLVLNVTEASMMFQILRLSWLFEAGNALQSRDKSNWIAIKVIQSR